MIKLDGKDYYVLSAAHRPHRVTTGQTRITLTGKTHRTEGTVRRRWRYVLQVLHHSTNTTVGTLQTLRTAYDAGGVHTLVTEEGETAEVYFEYMGDEVNLRPRVTETTDRFKVEVLFGERLT